jgi:hypothetical protein
MVNMQLFNDVLILSNLCLVSTYKYDVGNCIFDSISYLLSVHSHPFKYKKIVCNT